MIDLEVQILALEREGLLVDMGRVVAASGLTLQRQRLVDDRHGTLLTLLVRGQRRGRRLLDAALGAHERVVSFTIELAEGDVMRPHFAAARQVDYVPPPPPAPPPVAGKHEVCGPPMPPPPKVRDAEALAFFDRAPERTTWTEAVEPLPMLDIDADLPWEAWPAQRMAPAAAKPESQAASQPSAVAMPPLADPAPPLEADPVAVERLMRALPGAWPGVLPLVKAMEKAVVPEAREASLALAGSRVGRWIAARQGAHDLPISPDQALAQRGLPALGELLAAKLQGGQIHLGASPLCGKPGQSGCAFFTGVLQGAMGPTSSAGAIHVIGLCCHAMGADECVLTVTD